MIKSENKLVHMVVWCLPIDRNTLQCLTILFEALVLEKNVCNASLFAQYIKN